MTRNEAHRRAIEAGARAQALRYCIEQGIHEDVRSNWINSRWIDFKEQSEAAITAYLAAMVLPIPQHPSDTLPDVFIAFYENGHVTQCLFSECVGHGPDDHETFHPMIAPKDEKGRFLDVYEAPWPIKFTFLPEPPK